MIVGFRCLRLRLPQTRSRRILFVSLYLAFLAGLGWLGLRLFWAARSGVPLNETPRIWDVYYPELRRSGALTADLRADDGHFDVLMLGASVLHPSFGSIDRRLTEEVQKLTGNRARVFNLSVSGHTSRDSRSKFEQLANRPFDLVLVYHGINDVRMNNCKPGTFQDDYTHCTWYRGLQRRLAAGKVKLEITDQMTAMQDLISLGGGDENLRQYGRDLKTPPAFRKNFQAMIDVARTQREPLILMTFAWYIPADYTRQAFGEKRVDYSFRPDGHSCGVEMWGEPANVARTLAAHNAVIKDLAAKNSDVLFVDMAAGIAPRGENFVDPCHLTEQGCATFLDTLLPALKTSVSRWKRIGQMAPATRAPGTEAHGGRATGG